MKLLLRKIKGFFLNLFRQKKIRIKKIRKSGTYKFGDNYELLFEHLEGHTLNNCNITCGDNCKISCGYECVIKCGNNCIVNCKWLCNIICGNDCKIACWSESNIICGNDCIIICTYKCNITCGKNCEIFSICNSYIKAGEGTKINSYSLNVLKPISEGEEFIWWYIGLYGDLVNTYEDKNWKKENFNKWNEFYAFVHNELNSAILF